MIGTKMASIIKTAIFPSDGDFIGFHKDFMHEVANHIEQQETQLLYLKANAEGEKIAREAVQEELAELEKYAELGRLALTIFNNADFQHCGENYNDNCSDGCEWIDFCQLRNEVLESVSMKKRAELLAVSK